MEESEVLVPISSTNTNRSGSIRTASITRQAALSHSSRSDAPTDLFSAPSQAVQQSPDGRVAQTLPRDALQEADSLGDGGSGTLLHVLIQKPLRALVRLRNPTGALL